MFLGDQLQLWKLQPSAESQLSRQMKGENPSEQTHLSLNSLSLSLSFLPTPPYLFAFRAVMC